MDFNANISVSETDFETYIGNIIDERIDYDDLATEVVTHIDMDEVAQSIDYSNVADKVQEYLDYSQIAREVYDELDIDRIADSVQESFDVSYEAEKLLDSYNPGNGCNLGSSFTLAIASGMKYIFQNNTEDVKNDLIKLLFGDVIEQCISEAKPEIINEYIRQEKTKKEEEEKRLAEQKALHSNFDTSFPNVTTTSVVNNYGV